MAGRRFWDPNRGSCIPAFQGCGNIPNCGACSFFDPSYNVRTLSHSSPFVTRSSPFLFFSFPCLAFPFLSFSFLFASPYLLYSFPLFSFLIFLFPFFPSLPFFMLRYSFILFCFAVFSFPSFFHPFVCSCFSFLFFSFFPPLPLLGMWARNGIAHAGLAPALLLIWPSPASRRAGSP